LLSQNRKEPFPVPLTYSRLQPLKPPYSNKEWSHSGNSARVVRNEYSFGLGYVPASFIPFYYLNFVRLDVTGSDTSSGDNGGGGTAGRSGSGGSTGTSGGCRALGGRSGSSNSNKDLVSPGLSSLEPAF